LRRVDIAEVKRRTKRTGGRGNEEWQALGVPGKAPFAKVGEDILRNDIRLERRNKRHATLTLKK